jgi:HK97 family phage prohead protease
MEIRMQLERRQLGLVDCKLAGDATGTFSGYGAVFGNIDSYGDVIERGAFKDTLLAWQSKGKWPKMLLQHGGMGIGAEDMMPVGQWTSMSEDAKGLKVEGKLFALNTERGQYIYEGLKSGELDSLSIGYQTDAAYDTVKDGVTLRHLTKLNLWEVSIVTFPANDKALISSVKTLTQEELRDLEDALRDGGLSRTDSKTAVSVFRKHVLRDAGRPDSTLRDEVVPETAAASAAAERLAAKFAVLGLKF